MCRSARPLWTMNWAPGPGEPRRNRLAPGNRKPMSGAMYRPALERRPSAGWGPTYRRDGPARSRTNFFLPTLSHLILNEPALPSGVPYSIQWSPEFGDLALDLLAFSFVANESHLE